MADQAHLTLIKQGVQQWNEWREQNQDIRPDLSDAILASTNLSGANLISADLSLARLSGANLSGANLSSANLSNANLSLANLFGTRLISAVLINADLTDARLISANLTDAKLSSARLISADLTDAKLNEATIGWTQIGDRDLRVIKGLETVRHNRPSPLSINTVYLSKGNIPEAFVRGTGAPDSFIDYMHALAANPIEYYTCFISYSSKNRDFAERIYADLQSKGVRCWYDQEDLKIGDDFPEHIERAIRTYDKLLIILSETSVGSSWVEDEVRAAQEKEERFKREQQVQKTVLFPIKIDSAIDDANTQWAARLRRKRHIGNFINWKDHDSYQQAFQRLLRDLKADAKKEEQ